MRKKVVAMGLAAMMAMSLAACSSGGSSTSTTAAGSSAEATTAAAAASSEESKKEEAKGDGKGYVVALCNYSIGNSWRAQMEQEFVSEAEKLKSEGVVSEYYITNSNEDINKQISDMQDLITKKVDAIVITAASPTALAPVVEEATEAGIKVVSFDNVVDTDEQVATVGIDETEFGRIGAEWLAEKLDGKGKIIVLNGIAGAATDSLRWGGAEEVFKNYPDIEVLGSANASWDYAQGKAAVESMLSAYPEIDGVWSQGGAMTQGAVDAFVAAGRKLVPMSGEAGNGYIKTWIQYLGTDDFDSVAPNYTATISVTALNTLIDALDGKDVEFDQCLEMSTITSDDINDLYRDDLPDSFWCDTQLTEENLQKLFSE